MDDISTSSDDSSSEDSGSENFESRPMLPSSDSSSEDDDDDSSKVADEQSNSSNEGDSGSEDSDNEYNNMSLAEKIKLEEQRGIDREKKQQRKAKKALKTASEKLAETRKKNDTKEQKKKSKHAPTEISSKREDFYQRRLTLNENGVGVEVNAHRYKPRDPRIVGMSGHLDVEKFEQNYSFLQELREKEIKKLKKRIAARKLTGNKGQRQRRRLGITQDGMTQDDDEAELKRLSQEKAQFERSQIERSAKRTVKRKLQEEVASGVRGAYFLKRKEKKRLELEAKFEEIRKRGGDQAVQKAVAKRRKKNKSRDAKKLGRFPVENT